MVRDVFKAGNIHYTGKTTVKTNEVYDYPSGKNPHLMGRPVCFFGLIATVGEKNTQAGILSSQDSRTSCYKEL